MNSQQKYEQDLSYDLPKSKGDMQVKISNGPRTTTLFVNPDQMEMIKKAIYCCLEGKNTHIDYKDPGSEIILTADYLKNSLIEFVK